MWGKSSKNQTTQGINMSAINYDTLNDNEKMDLLRLLYTDLKNKEKKTARDLEQKILIVNEAQRVYNRLKQRSH